MTLTVFGSVNMDVVTRVSSLPRPGETVAALRLDHFPGGKGANQAVAAARFGHSTRLIAAIGNDDHGDRLMAFLSGEGIDLSGVIRLQASTGMAHIAVSQQGENQIVVIAGANAELTCPDRLADGRGGVFLAQLEAPVAGVASFLEQGRRRGARTILNAAPALPEARQLLGSTDMLIVNETELAVFCDTQPGIAADDPVRLARSLVGDSDRWVVVTLGGAGAVAVSRRDTIIRPARPAHVIDTTGAGDTFCGVLAASLAEGAAMEHALDNATIAASLAVEQEGAALSMPRREDVLRAFNAVA